MAAAEACRRLQERHKIFSRAESLVKVWPTCAEELLGQIVEQAPPDSECFRYIGPCATVKTDSRQFARTEGSEMNRVAEVRSPKSEVRNASSSRREEAHSEFLLRYSATVVGRRLLTSAATLVVMAMLLSSVRAEEIFLRANQLGYGLRDAKIAVAFSRSALPPAFSVVEADSQKVAFEGTAKPVAARKWGQFENHAELDFSALKTPGRYVLRVGDAQSLPFTVGGATYRHLPDDLLDFMRQQRCGYNPWLGADCHQFDGRTAYGPLTNGTHIDARGGWHDAADQLKYLITSANATAQMLLAYELGTRNSQRAAQPAFADRVNDLGQPGANGIPDLLDEARWGLDWMLKLHPAPDQLYHQVADDRDHCGLAPAAKRDRRLRLGQGQLRASFIPRTASRRACSNTRAQSTGVANLAGRYAAAMALGLSDLEGRSAAGGVRRSAACKRAGRSMSWAGRRKACSRAIPTRRRIATRKRPGPTTWNGARRNCSAPRDERRYLDDAKRYAQLAADEGWMGREQTEHYQCYPFMNVGHFRLYDLVDRRVQEAARRLLPRRHRALRPHGRRRIRIASACRSSGARTTSSPRWSRNACSTSA